ncbi:hypothetical protein FOA52_015564 [Chlamydomonas sp. UWO 241]|nr:hypothetical protein FOA52_015564 [Chlamydomonas sp. UWO 241]
MLGGSSGSSSSSSSGAALAAAAVHAACHLVRPDGGPASAIVLPKDPHHCTLCVGSDAHPHDTS